MGDTPPTHLGNMNVCGQRIRQVRLSYQPPISQSKLVDDLDKLGVLLDRTSLSRIENQQRSLTDEELIAIAKCLNTAVAFLVGETSSTARNRKAR